MSFYACVAFFVTASTPRHARGEGGELTARIISGQNLARLDLGEENLSSASLYLPRLGVQLVYGVTHWLQAGIEAQASLPRHYSSTTTKAYRGIVLATVTRAYHDVVIAIPVEFRRPRGTALTLWAEFAPALQIAFSKDASLIVASPPRRVDLAPHSQSQISFLGQARGGLEWRPTTAFAARAGLGIAGSDAKNLFVGAFLSFDYLLPLGGHL